MVEEAAEVWYVAEQQGGALSPLTAGLGAEARRIAQAMRSRTVGVLLGHDVGALAEALSADVVYVGEHQALAAASPEVAAAALTQALRERRPSALLLAATPFGSELAARLAARLRTGLASGCLRLDVDSDGTLLMLRPAYGGRASCTVVCPSSRPQIATLLPESLPAEALRRAEPEVLPLCLQLDEFRARTAVQRIERPPPSSLDVGRAEVVVAGGRGVGGPEGFRLLEELAGLLGGAAAASRPAVDAGWAPVSRQVGSSGQLVAPRLYIACGISGASQHVVGMRDSQMVVAINRDPYAPIVSMADLALVGDLHEVLPHLLDSLRRGAEPAPSQPGFAPCEYPAGDVPSSEAVHCIAVCLSRSQDPETAFDARNAADLEASPRLLGAADLCALEEGLRLKNRLPQARVVALHAGPGDGEDVLRQALAVGADDAVLLWDEAFAGSDSLATARILAAAVRRLGATVVLCGSRGADGFSGQLPIQLGELLDAAAVSDVVALAVEAEGRVTARRQLEWGREAVVVCSAPAVLAVEPGMNRPRYPRLRERLRAQVRALPQWGCAELGLAEDEVGTAGSGAQVLRVGPPKPVARGIAVGETELSAEQRLQQLMGGAAPLASQTPGRPNIVRGPPDQLAQTLLAFLLEHGFVRGAA